MSHTRSGICSQWTDRSLIRRRCPRPRSFAKCLESSQKGRESHDEKSFLWIVTDKTSVKQPHAISRIVPRCIVSKHNFETHFLIESAINRLYLISQVYPGKRTFDLRVSCRIGIGCINRNTNWPGALEKCRVTW